MCWDLAHSMCISATGPDHKEHSETAVEFFYKAQLTGWLAVQPDLQYITNPGGDINKNALVLGRAGRVCVLAKRRHSFFGHR